MILCFLFSADRHLRCKWLGTLSSLLLYLLYVDYSLNQWLLNTYCDTSNENNAKKDGIIHFKTRIYHLPRSLENSEEAKIHFYYIDFFHSHWRKELLLSLFSSDKN